MRISAALRIELAERGRGIVLIVPARIGRSNIHGIGLFAAEMIARGTTVWQYDSRLDLLFSRRAQDTLPEPMQAFLCRYGNVVSDDLIMLCADNARFINHSQDANIVGISSWITDCIALRDIAKGEEITENYSTFCIDFREP
jgi:hypothetical protein